MATSNQTTTPTTTSAAKTAGNSAAPAAKKPRRVAAGKAIRIDTDMLAKLDERAQQMVGTFGSKPTPSQVIGYLLLRTQQAIDAAKAATTAQPNA